MSNKRNPNYGGGVAGIWFVVANLLVIWYFNSPECNSYFTPDGPPPHFHPAGGIRFLGCKLCNLVKFIIVILKEYGIILKDSGASLLKGFLEGLKNLK